MPRPEPPRPDVGTDLFEAERARLTRLAYRMTGSVAEAEDVVQDAWLRWQGREEAVDSPAAYLTRIVTRLCLDRMKSARVRRETYVGAWLPEPLLETPAPDEEAWADDVTYSLMLALERLSPLERAAFLLHDVFDVPLGEVATSLGREAAAVRQLAVRARKHVEQARPRFTVEQAEADRIVAAFGAASRSGDTAALRSLLAEDVVITSDGGGRVLAFLNPISGVEKALRLFAGLARKRRYEQAPVGRITIDGLPGFVTIENGRLLQTTAVEIRDGRIAAIYIMRNPDKLRHVAATLGLSGISQG